MIIAFLTDEQAKKLGVSYLDTMKVKRYSLAPANVVVDNVICSKRRFGKLLGRTALRLLEEEK